MRFNFGRTLKTVPLSQGVRDHASVKVNAVDLAPAKLADGVFDPARKNYSTYP